MAALTGKEQIKGPSKNQIKAGLKAFFRVMEDWEIADKEAMILLGQPSRSLFYKWKKGEVGNFPHDTMSRLSYILGIYKSLQILFPDTDRADSWINKPNSSFGGKSAKDKMLAGEIVDVAEIRQHLDAARGAW